MKVIVVEPHCDDAFLSLGWHIERLWRSLNVLILTVYADAARTREAGAYAAAVGARSRVLGLAESATGLAAPVASPAGPVASPAGPARRAGLRALPEVRNALREELGLLEPMDLIVPADTLVLFPLGLQHPDHLQVAASRIPGCGRYLDTPYQTKQKLAQELRDKTEGMYLYSLCYPGKRKWKHVPLFKSQSKFFHFNDLSGCKIPETILYPLD
jgi:hypothetical protein